MDSIKKMNEALSFVEENLTDEIDYKEVARLAFCSEYHFQRMFSFLAGVSLSEYVRRRRLTIAAFELIKNDIKIIDIAIKYGYSSPDSFTRAFQNLHGITPSEARNNGHSLKAYPRMTFQLSIKGGSEMNYRIEEKEAFQIVGIMRRVPIIFNGVNPEISAMWQGLGMEIINQLKELSNVEPIGLLKLINNIVDISKLDSGYLELKLSNENIVQVTEDIVQSVSEFIKEKGLNITFDTNTEEKIISCDPNKIERIILNLISNSIKFTNPGGAIFVGIIDKGNNIEISVEDTGIGIDKEHLDNIFERFSQVEKSLSRNSGGSGIGLSLVKSIVELHGGEISVESKPNVGSIFKIVLPVRTVENPKVIEQSNAANNRIDMINLEFSDLYSNGY